MKPRLLVISGRFLAVSGGAEISALSLLTRLQQEWEIVVLTCNFQGKHSQAQHQAIAIQSVPFDELEFEGAKLIARWSPRLIYTLMLGSDSAMRLGAQFGIPTIVNVCKVPVGPKYLRTHPPTKVLAVSAFVQEYLRTTHGVHSTVVNPIVEYDAPPLSPAPRYLTIFNPVKPKGGLLFRTLAERLPRHEFAWVPGWDILRGADGGFNVTICAAISRSIDIAFTGGTPEEVSFDLPNIQRLDPIFPPHPLFQKTRILLVPSQWNEAFGRVAVEGMLFGVPVLGSAVGGLADLVRNGGTCLPKNDVKAWEDEIRKLDDPGCYREIQARGEAWRQQWLARDHEPVTSVFREFM